MSTLRGLDSTIAFSSCVHTTSHQPSASMRLLYEAWLPMHGSRPAVAEKGCTAYSQAWLNYAVWETRMSHSRGPLEHHPSIAQCSWIDTQQQTAQPESWLQGSAATAA